MAFRQKKPYQRMKQQLTPCFFGKYCCSYGAAFIGDKI